VSTAVPSQHLRAVRPRCAFCDGGNVSVPVAARRGARLPMPKVEQSLTRSEVRQKLGRLRVAAAKKRRAAAPGSLEDVLHWVSDA